MKKIFIVGALFISISLLFACNNNQGNNADKQKVTASEDVSLDAGTIQVYYFHGSIRCETCVSVDENTHQYLKELFPDSMDNGDIIFKSINIDKNERPDLVEKYQIYGQTLLFIMGDTVVDKTDDAFLYVTTNPEKWKQIVKDNIINFRK